MEENIPIYDVYLDDDVLGLTAVSFVKHPAIQKNFVFLNNVKRVFLSKQKHEVVSPVLIPEQLIYRRDEAGEYYIKWSKETIEEMALNFLLNQFQNNVTYEHPDKDIGGENYWGNFIDNVYLMKMWIIDDPETDEANTVYGFNDLPQGTLMFHYKVLNDELWEHINNRDVEGLSVEVITKINRLS